MVHHTFSVIGVIEQPQGSNPPQVYIPLQPTQRLYASSDSLSSAEVVNTIYVQTASAADISSVQSEISGLMPSATITSDSTLAGQISGSLASTAALARDLGAWLAILTLSAAFTVAALLTLGAVGRRAREFGTLKALGWMSRRIVAQVMGESLVVGIMGGASGILLGLAGAALISARAPVLSATVPAAGSTSARGSGLFLGGHQVGVTASHTVRVVLATPVGPGTLTLAIGLALAGGIIAGSFSGWRIARLRPAIALARVE